MQFIDQARITVKAGDGGRGCSSFAQPPYTRYPYPDGGDGGDGGDVILRADPNIATLLDFQFLNEFQAGRGGHGGSNTKRGRHGEDRIILVPVGTVLYDEDSSAQLRDLDRAGEQLAVAHGGRGGLGNGTRRVKRNTPPTRQQRRAQSRLGPRAHDATPGSPGEEHHLRLELKLIADVGLIGLPNAGKSSLLTRISTAHPKIAAYPFTTRYPVLGVVDFKGQGAFVACDIPGLIEGAHAGKGLGIQFLRHIERTRLLVHVIDMAAIDNTSPIDSFHQINRELKAWGRGVAAKPQLIVANKMDLPEAAANLRAFRRTLGPDAAQVLPISCATGNGIPDLIEAVWKALHQDTMVPQVTVT